MNKRKPSLYNHCIATIVRNEGGKSQAKMGDAKQIAQKLCMMLYTSPDFHIACLRNGKRVMDRLIARTRKR